MPRNKLVAFTLAGALLTLVVAGALAAPLGGLAQSDEGTTLTTPQDSAATAAADSPTPNSNFTPAVQTQSDHDEAEYEEHDDEEDEHEEHEEREEEHDDEEDEHEEE